MTARAATSDGVRLDPREDWQQFSLRVLINPFVGGIIA
jgi:hypothetical protein